MILATVEIGDMQRVAVIDDGKPVSLLATNYQSVDSVVRAMAVGSSPLEDLEKISAFNGRVLAPIPRPRRNVFCVGKNYDEHAKEFSASGFDSSASGKEVQGGPVIFSKVPESVIGPGDAIIFSPSASSAVDYEVELAVIIGKQGKAISRQSAMDYVWGYTIVNDVTARDVQQRLKQWHVGKSFDTFCPMGPWAVSADELDLTDTWIRSWINGELRQDANTRDLTFDVPAIIETLSAGMTLYPGDIIATGTPAGVGIGFKPPRYLADGDHIRMEIAGLGSLENNVRVIP